MITKLLLSFAHEKFFFNYFVVFSLSARFVIVWGWEIRVTCASCRKGFAVNVKRAGILCFSYHWLSRCTRRFSLDLQSRFGEIQRVSRRLRNTRCRHGDDVSRPKGVGVVVRPDRPHLVPGDRHFVFRFLQKCQQMIKSSKFNRKSQKQQKIGGASRDVSASRDN